MRRPRVSRICSSESGWKKDGKQPLSNGSGETQLSQIPHRTPKAGFSQATSTIAGSLSPGIINVRLAAVRRLAYEGADTGLLRPDLAAGIRRVNGMKKLGMRLGELAHRGGRPFRTQPPEVSRLVLRQTVLSDWTTAGLNRRPRHPSGCDIRFERGRRLLCRACTRWLGVPHSDLCALSAHFATRRKSGRPPRGKSSLADPTKNGRSSWISRQIKKFPECTGEFGKKAAVTGLKT